MTQVARQKNLTPPGNWRARCPHCGFWMKHYSWHAFDEMVRKHNAANGHEPWDHESAACEQLPPGSCVYADGSHPAPFDTEMNVEALAASAHALAALTAEYLFGNPLVDQAEAERRAAICARCNYNQEVRACLNCNGLTNIKNLIHKAVGDNKTSMDASLWNCRTCTCSLKTIVWIKGDILEKGFTENQRARSPGHCWKLQMTENPTP